MSIYQMVLRGGAAVGAALWGQVAGVTGLHAALLLSAAAGPEVELATPRCTAWCSSTRPASSPTPKPALAVDWPDSSRPLHLPHPGINARYAPTGS
jgi:hypothetical protein